ncbi:hypothetical protein QA640_34350 [Bradyrhizobium sp. CB82]|uniref:hypothetical protein n=1 Tax=Bradyrhizobium sp. CB82 TaxID=3039159 RepID=UPI0024B0989C|nr:hypothetical protein [Bradyrhizobium sp. CB82]WFU39405.1 hypothetical protein QA640_34350 [Bradyrhizobium sp. CB82]
MTTLRRAEPTVAPSVAEPSLANNVSNYSTSYSIDVVGGTRQLARATTSTTISRSVELLLTVRQFDPRYMFTDSARRHGQADIAHRKSQ